MSIVKMSDDWELITDITKNHHEFLLNIAITQYCTSLDSIVMKSENVVRIYDLRLSSFEVKLS